MEQSNLLKIISNYGSRLWSMFSVFIFVPIYIKFFGIENYAVIGFYTLLLGIISFADSGMSSAIIKEFSLENTANYKYSVLRKIENLYLFICITICLNICLFSGFISVKWLNSSSISSELLQYYVVLIGIGTAIQLLSSLYFGALFGIGLQVKSNIYQIIWNIFKAGIVLLPVIFFKASLSFYFILQIICNILYVLVLRFSVIKILKKECSNKLQNFLTGIPKHMLTYIGGMTFIAIISAINSQADKITISTYFTLKEFGYYNIASILSQIPVILAAPITLFVFPLFSKFAYSDNKSVHDIFNKVTFLLILIVLPVSFSLLFFNKEILFLWANKNIEFNMYGVLGQVITLLTIGSLFLALQFPFFYLLLSKGKTKYTIYQGVIQLVVGIPLLYFCASLGGITAVPFPWILINFGSFIFLMIIVFKNFLKIDLASFFKRNYLIPVFINIILVVLIYYIFKKVNVFPLVWIIMFCILSVTVNVLIDNFLNKRNRLDYIHLFNFPK